MCVKTKFPGPDPATGRGLLSQKKMKKLTLLYVFHNIATACGGIVTSLNSVIQSPSYPSHYPNGVMCVWTIKIGQAFQLEYDAFNTEQSYDFLKAYNSLQSFSSTYQWRYHKYVNLCIYTEQRTKATCWQNNVGRYSASSIIRTSIIRTPNLVTSRAQFNPFFRGYKLMKYRFI